jgi:FSR family fosmidomycin resistance protein-like MFS transporter
LKLKVVTFQRAQLVVLAVSHFIIDIFAGLLPAILPVVMSVFSISLGRAVAVLTILNLTSNFVQLITGHMREDKRKPFFLYLGLIFSPAICLIALLPAVRGSYPVILLLAVITGCAVAMTHPEGLKAVHTLRRFSSVMGTSVYLSSGLLGYSAASFVSAALVSLFGLGGLCWLVICPVTCILGLIYFRVKIAVERKPAPNFISQIDKEAVNFWPLLFMAITAVSTTTILFGFLPTRLNQLGFELTFGGFSAMILGLAGALGPFLWAAVARKYSELTSVAIALIIGIPLLIVYLFTMNSKIAVLALTATGLSSTAVYPLMVSMARNARGFKLGQRMAFIVGGAWGLASLLLMAAGYAAENFGLQKVLTLAPLGYIIAAIIAVVLIIRRKTVQ